VNLNKFPKKAGVAPDVPPQQGDVSKCCGPLAGFAPFSLWCLQVLGSGGGRNRIITLSCESRDSSSCCSQGHAV